MKYTFIVLMIAACATSFAQSGKPNPGSLYDPTTRNMFADNVARRVGDVLMVLVDETTIATFAASTDATKNDSSGISTKFFNSFLDSILKPITTAGNSSVSGDGKTQQSSKMAATMSVVVKQVMPNGNLVIEGRRSLITNKQTQTLILSGIVRQEDVGADNTVASSKIAEAEIKMDGSGMINQRQRKGFLTQVIDWIF